MKSFRSILPFLFAGIFCNTTAKAGGPESAGHFAVSVNPLSWILKAMPVALDLRTGGIVHEFRYCYFRPQSTATLYSFFPYHDVLGKSYKFSFGKSAEYNYMMKFLIRHDGHYLLDDDNHFMSLYFGMGYLEGHWNMTSGSYTASKPDGTNQFTFTESPEIVTRTGMLAFGLICFPHGGIYYDMHMAMGIRSSRMNFQSKDPFTGNTVSLENNLLLDPKIDNDEWKSGHSMLYLTALIRFGYSF